MGPLAATTPVWVSAPIEVGGRSVVVAVTVALTIVLLHAVAAERLGPAWLVVSSVPLGAQALWAHLLR